LEGAGDGIAETGKVEVDTFDSSDRESVSRTSELELFGLWVLDNIVKRVSTNFLFDRGVSGANIAGKALSEYHLYHNMGFTFTGFLTNQISKDRNNNPTDMMKMGIAPLGSNACGWMAAYNSFHVLEMEIHPAQIIRWLERNNGLNADGIFGVNPYAYEGLFNNFGVDARTTLFTNRRWDDINNMGKSCSSLIIAYVNKGGISKGAHYVTAVWDENAGMYTFYNVSENNPTLSFATITEFISARAESLISITQVW
jgi:hypothetical protein